jgi:hypothetical protein
VTLFLCVQLYPLAAACVLNWWLLLAVRLLPAGMRGACVNHACVAAATHIQSQFGTMYNIMTAVKAVPGVLVVCA